MLVYIRQSSMAQVRDNTESTARQYALADEAVRLGWARSQVEVIDADLGLSGRSAEGRSGFKDLVGRVCMGEVGAIFGLEVSRLARSSADLSRLLELARLTDTLVVDSDGIYDLANFNDRLLLGLKGTDVRSRAALSWPAGCKEPSGPRRSEASCVSRCLSASSTTTRATPSSTLTARCKRRWPTSSRRSVPAARPTRWWPRSRGAASRCAPMAGCGPASCAGDGSPTPGCSASWPTRPTPAPTCSAATTPAASSNPTARCAPSSAKLASRGVAGRHPRPSPRLHHLGRLPGQPGPPGRQHDQRRGPAATGGLRAVPGDHHLRLVRASHVDPLSPQRTRRL